MLKRYKITKPKHQTLLVSGVLLLTLFIMSEPAFASMSTIFNPLQSKTTEILHGIKKWGLIMVGICIAGTLIGGMFRGHINWAAMAIFGIIAVLLSIVDTIVNAVVGG